MKRQKGNRLRLIYHSRPRWMNNIADSRLDWKQMEPREDKKMLKGTTRRIIVVKSPDPNVFDEAIFIMRDDFLRKRGGDPEQAVKEARRVADDYVRSCLGRTRKLFLRISPPICAAAGAAAAGAAWLAMHFIAV